MKNFNVVGWFDIYVEDMERAAKFYQFVLKQELGEMNDPTGETQMLSFPSDMSLYGASGALVKSKHSRPGVGGTMIYFSVDDCKSCEPLVTQAGGKVLRQKFSIGEFGYITLCEDTEGNTFGLSSMK